MKQEIIELLEDAYILNINDEKILCYVYPIKPLEDPLVLKFLVAAKMRDFKKLLKLISANPRLVYHYDYV